MLLSLSHNATTDCDFSYKASKISLCAFPLRSLLSPIDRFVGRWSLAFSVFNNHCSTSSVHILILHRLKLFLPFNFSILCLVDEATIGRYRLIQELQALIQICCGNNKIIKKIIKTYTINKIKKESLSTLTRTHKIYLVQYFDNLCPCA